MERSESDRKINKNALQADRYAAKARAVLNAPIASVPEVGNWPVISTALALRSHANDLPVPLSDTVLAKHQATQAIVERNKLPVFFMGYSTAFPSVYVYQGPQADWGVLNLAADPILQQYGGKLVAPKAVVKDIKRLKRTGLDWEALYIAHEIPGKRLKAGDPLPIDLILPPPPPQAAAELDLLERGAEMLWKGVGNTLKSVLTAGVAVAAGTASIAALAMAAPASAAFAAVSYDPVLFGLHLDYERPINGRPLALWYYLTHWYW